MANNKTNAMENEVLTFYLRPGDSAPTRPSALYLALFTSDPGEAGVATAEIATASGYTRQAIAFSAPTTGSVANSGTVSFGPASADWGSITHVGICRSGTRATADLLYYMPLTTPQTVLTNQYLDFAASSVTVSEE